MPFSKFKKKDQPRTHEECRRLLCAMCSRKNCDRVVTEKIADLIRKYHEKDYSKDNTLHPIGICSTCRKTMFELEKDPSASRRFPPLFDYSEIRDVHPHTRSYVDCTCRVCEICRFHILPQCKYRVECDKLIPKICYQWPNV